MKMIGRPTKRAIQRYIHAVAARPMLRLLQSSILAAILAGLYRAGSVSGNHPAFIAYHSIVIVPCVVLVDTIQIEIALQRGVVVRATIQKFIFMLVLNALVAWLVGYFIFAT